MESKVRPRWQNRSVMSLRACIKPGLCSAGRFSRIPARQGSTIVPICHAFASFGTAFIRAGDVLTRDRATLTREKMTFIPDGAPLFSEKVTPSRGGAAQSRDGAAQSREKMAFFRPISFQNNAKNSCKPIKIKKL